MSKVSRGRKQRRPRLSSFSGDRGCGRVPYSPGSIIKNKYIKIKQSKKARLKRELFEKLQQKLHLKIQFLTHTSHIQVLLGHLAGGWGTAISEEALLARPPSLSLDHLAQPRTALAWMV